MQEPVYVLHFITCHGRIRPHLAELLFGIHVCSILGRQELTSFKCFFLLQNTSISLFHSFDCSFIRMYVCLFVLL